MIIFNIAMNCDTRKGHIFDIQHFSLHDGPGIRTTVFMKGCNLRCNWCHNPEGIVPAPQLRFFVRNCANCGTCALTCPHAAHQVDNEGHKILREMCAACGGCAETCANEALILAGREISVSELVENVIEDTVYYRHSGGGVTFSGGEPMLQVDFLQAAIRELKKYGVHICVETAGDVPYHSFEKINDHTDLYLYDLKVFDTEAHKRYTGSGNDRILDNLSKLINTGKNIILRIPLIPGHNTSQENIISTIVYIKTLTCVPEVQLLPYHRLGGDKYTSLDMDYSMPEVIELTDTEREQILGIFSENGLQARIS